MCKFAPALAERTVAIGWPLHNRNLPLTCLSLHQISSHTLFVV